MEQSRLILNEERNVSLTCYIQPVGGEYWGMTKRPAMTRVPPEPSTGIWPTRRGGARSFPENIRSIMRKCTAAGKRLER